MFDHHQTNVVYCASMSITCDDTSRGLPSTAAVISTENMAGSHVLTIDGYSKAKKALRPGKSFESECLHVGGHYWYMELYPNGEKDKDTHCLPIFLVSDGGAAVKVRFELTLLTLAMEVILSTQSCYAFSWPNNTRCGCRFLGNMEPESSPSSARQFPCQV
jgi:hypothetical protein